MLDPTSPRDRAISALMRLAETTPWREIFMPDIAREAGLTYAELMEQFSSKARILGAFVRSIDTEVSERMAAKPATEGARDRLFDTIMTRFEVLQPYRAAMRRLARETPDVGLALHPKTIARSLRSSLEAARIDASGGLGCVRLAGLGGVYSRTFKTWLDDDDPGLARTMAKLDRQLRSGEQAMRTVEDICGGVDRLFNAFRSRRHSETSKPEQSTSAPV
jgi:AcrR family transcriptional regulator